MSRMMDKLFVTRDEAFLSIDAPLIAQEGLQ